MKPWADKLSSRKAKRNYNERSDQAKLDTADITQVTK